MATAQFANSLTYITVSSCSQFYYGQMIANAKASGDEIATLRMRIMELEMGATGPIDMLIP